MLDTLSPKAKKIADELLHKLAQASVQGTPGYIPGTEYVSLLEAIVSELDLRILAMKGGSNVSVP